MVSVTAGRGAVKGVTVAEATENRKLGSVSATYVSQASCPTDCPFLGSGCYAETGPMAFTTRRLNRSTERAPHRLAQQEASAIDGLTGDKLLRLHVVGDSRTTKAAQTVAAACTRYARRGMAPRKGKKVWGYTHAWKSVPRTAWGQDVAILASCETVRDARKAMARGYAAAVVVCAFERDSAYPIDGTTVIPCPNQTRGITCRECGLCRDDERLRSAGLVIAFAAHGAGTNKVKGRLALPMV